MKKLLSAMVMAMFLVGFTGGAFAMDEMKGGEKGDHKDMKKDEKKAEKKAEKKEDKKK